MRKVRSSEEFIRAKATLEGVSWAERVHDEETRRKCDWDDPEDIAFYRSNKTRARRERVIHRRTDGKFICPSCGCEVRDPAKWVILRNRSVICRKCFSNPRSKDVSKKDSAKTADSAVFKAVFRFELDPAALQEAREIGGVTKAVFASMCGWGRAYQQKLESGQVKSLEQEQAMIVMRVFQKLGVTTPDSSDDRLMKP